MQLDKLPDSAAEYVQPSCVADKDPTILTSIYQDQVNIAVWQRQHQLSLDAYAKAWSEYYSSHSLKLILPINKLEEQLEKSLPALEHKELFQKDIALIVDMFACLFDATEVGLRITPLTKAMCPNEWLLEENLDRNRLGRGANGLPDNESGILQGDKFIQQVSSQQIALLKGSGWLGNEKYGLVHRSPYLAPGQTRLLVTLDFSE